MHRLCPALALALACLLCTGCAWTLTLDRLAPPQPPLIAHPDVVRFGSEFGPELAPIEPAPAPVVVPHRSRPRSPRVETKVEGQRRPGPIFSVPRVDEEVNPPRPDSPPAADPLKLEPPDVPAPETEIRSGRRFPTPAAQAGRQLTAQR